MTDSRMQYVKQWLEAIVETGRGLTEWEGDFIDSVERQFDAGRELSTRQLDIIERIYADKTP